MEAQERLEEEAEDLLGGESGNVCTYPQVFFLVEENWFFIFEI